MIEHLNKQIENISNSKQVYSDMLSVLSESNIDHELYEYIFDKICVCDEKINKYNSRIKQSYNFIPKTSNSKIIETINHIQIIPVDEQIKTVFDKIKSELRIFTHEDYPNIIYHINNENLVYMTQDNNNREFKCRYDMWKQFITINESPASILNDILEKEYNVSGYYTDYYHWKKNNFNIEKFITNPQMSDSLCLSNYVGCDCDEIICDLSLIDNDGELFFVENLQKMLRTRYSEIPYKEFYTIDGYVYMIEDILEKTLLVRYEDFWNEYAGISKLSFQEIIEKIRFYMKKYRNVYIKDIKTLSHKNTTSSEKEIKALYRSAEKLN